MITGTDPRTGRSVGGGAPEAGPVEAVAAAEAAAEALRTRPDAGEPGDFDDAALLDAVAAGLAEVGPSIVARVVPDPPIAGAALLGLDELGAPRAAHERARRELTDAVEAPAAAIAGSAGDG